ncbi:TonB-dependent receptor [Flectobacillus roseus]|uniref:TonB-dependent receptor n=1 Tax=Flectobacillus roseus TaxID=502259 RepID=A0ABT6Y5K7_9BACT|nr:TonB-dependent receptor [Flectobacillus roseus]MDI9858847.1 TonB-dependent receptor [Flectobacillus roseus]
MKTVDNGLLTRLLLVVLLLFIPLFSSQIIAQTLIKGAVFEQKNNATLEPLVGASVRWANAKNGVLTDTEGNFSIAKQPENHELIVSFVGYKTDTLMVHSMSFVKVILETAGQLGEITVTSSPTNIDRLNPIQTEFINTKTLVKAACCNLSESFETNASVSVSYADAITGSKQIQMLGLSGNYVQTNVENIPNVRGLATTFGLNYIPGTWISSIDVSKGASSVVNGYESMTGALNVELQKPDNSDKLYVNNYINSFGRGELNINAARKLNDKWSVGLLTHGSGQSISIDQNNDTFRDLPLFGLATALNRWKYQSDRMMAQFGIKGLYESRTGGQNAADFVNKPYYEFGNRTKRVEAFAKIAALFPEKPYKGLGFIMNASVHDANAYFGLTSRSYTGLQKTFYSNLIYQNIIDNTNHTYKIGASFIADSYRESYLDSAFHRNEIVPGVFGEYTYVIPEKFTLVLGGRMDFHNLYGNRFTPRIHAKYDLSSNTHLRASAGKGWRMPNAIAENFAMLVNSRQLLVLDQIRPEESWNYGASLSHDFKVGTRNANLTLDYYRTDFNNQLIVDMESAYYIKFYNQKGKSFSNSFQAELNYSPIKRMDVKLAYRLFDVKNDIVTSSGELALLPKMFVNRDRILVNIGYATKFDKWKFDLTWQWNGKRRIPDASHEHVHSIDSEPVYAPAFSNINAQVTRGFYRWELYVGGENLTGFRQNNPIMSASSPFSKHFDASMVWGPITGRMVYVGMRWKIPSKV